MKNKNDKLRKKIIASTTAIIVQQGISSVSTIKVGQQSGTTQSNVYSYFKNKKDLLIGTFKYHQTLLTNTLKANKVSTDKPVEYINSLFQMLLEFGETNSQSIQLITSFRSQPDLRPSLPTISDSQYFTELFAVLEKYQSEKILKEYNLEFLADSCFLIVSHYIVQTKLQDSVSQADVIKILDDLVLKQ